MRGQVNYRIGIDLLGSDLPAEQIAEAVFFYSQEWEGAVSLLLLATPELIRKLPPPSSSISYYPVASAIQMDELPLEAIRNKKDSSLCAGVSLLKEGRLDAFISCGNTGALIAETTLSLGLIGGVKRPAYLTLLPVQEGEMAVLDVGAMLKADASRFVELGLMGAVYQRARGIALPKVGLLNIGAEAQKGTIEHKEAYKQLQHLSENGKGFVFVGNVEGRDAFLGKVDVLVTDGFTGNVFLKTAEGVAAFLLNQVAALFGEKSSALRSRMHYTEHPGAVICGVESLVIKCHGEGNPKSVVHSIRAAISLLNQDFLEKMRLLAK
ncbi:MAG: phosphate acyltransferase [Chlamydiota bacterium]|jgi:glycerol-3-phosphate acyltransferase PlsX